LTQLSSSERQTIVFRLTALWALNESGLGGFLHALNFPFTGLIVGSIAVALISFIIFFSDADRTVLFNSLIIVLIIKLLMSPHSSVTAYFAVSFQAVCAYFIYRFTGIHLISILMVCILSFLESATQKLLTLTIIGGMPFWNALDIFIDNISKQLFSFQISNGATWLVSIYLGIYVFFAVLSAFFIYSLLEHFKILNFQARINESLKAYHNVMELQEKKPRPLWVKIILYSSIIIFVLVTFFVFNKGEFADNFLIYYFFRTVSILLFWYYILMPYAMVLIKKYLNKKLPLFQNEVDEIIHLFPKLKLIIYYSWDESAAYRGLKRLKHFFTLTLIEIITYK
jgi:hypothetical protein